MINGVLPTATDLQIPSGAKQVDVIGYGNPKLTLPSAPRKGDSVLISTCTATAIVHGGCFPLCGGDASGDVVMSTCDSIRFTFTACCSWSMLRAATAA